MKVLIYGASGGIGTWAMKRAKALGYEVTAYVRNASKITDPDVRVIEGSIVDAAKVEKALRGQDAVIWCVGIPMKRRYESKESLEGHKVLLNAMHEEGVERLVDWGTPSVHFKDDRTSFITVVPGILASIGLTDAKAEMVAIGNLLEKSDTSWTMVRFMMPTNAPGAGKVKVGFGDVKMNLAISREDIGAFMAEQVESTAFIRSMPIIGS